MYLDSIAIIRSLPCLAEPGKIIVVGKPNRPLNDVIPYLATLPSVITYNPDTLALTFRREAGFITIYPEKVYIIRIKDLDEGITLFKALVEAINATWLHREELAAATKARHAPRWLDILVLLPQTNCKQCGEATCMAFAASLLQHKRTVTECIPLAEDEGLSDRRVTLEAML
jgi:ArsR family metal-binding transcriptional regulator